MKGMEFKDDRMEYIEDDIKKIQDKTGMYISYVGEKGALHLAKEVIQNAIDECANPKSPANSISIILDTVSDTLTVEDNGRGIPETEFPMDILCTKLNSGSKFTREQGGASSGENGVGNTAVNAVSSKFTWESYRGHNLHKISFENGKKVLDEKQKKTKKDHGCIVSFSPSKKYLGKTASIPKKGLIEWVSNISYFIPEKCKIKLVIYKGIKLDEEFTYKAKPISELLQVHITDALVSPIFSFHAKKELEEDFRGERKIKRNLFLEFSFAYSSSIEPWIDSYCNYVNTTSGGVHLNSVQEAIWRYLVKKTNETLSEKEKEKYKVLKVDVETSLNLVVNIFTDLQMQFVGQTKNEVSNEQLVDPIKELANIELDKFFTENKNELANIIKIVKSNCKARVEASKIKATVMKESVNNFEKHTMENYTPCNNSGKAYKELHLCEGKSAKGSLVDGRDPDTQAFLSFRGVTANGFKRTEATILENKEWYDYVKLLKTNFGPKFDITKLYYDKIIIETDSDIDGFGITSGIGAFHALYLPEIVKAGKLYKALAPLYHIDDKNHEFVRDKREYVELYQGKIIKNYKIALLHHTKKDKLDEERLKEFIFDTEEYSTDLARIGNHYKVNKFLIELAAAYITNHVGLDIDADTIFNKNKFVLGFMEAIQNRFPEITLKGKHSLRGVIDGHFQSININNRFLAKVKDIAPVFEKYGCYLEVTEKKGVSKVMSIGQFLDLTEKFKPRIITRYKGLGEANSQQLWDTTLNPDNRILIQLTMEDVERDLEIFRKLHGQSKKDLEERKKMMTAYKIRRDDLDN